MLKKVLKVSAIVSIAIASANAAVPAMPGEYVGVYNVTSDSARISFLDNSANEDGFKVYVKDSNGNMVTSLSQNPILVPKNDSGSLYQYANITNLDANTLYLLSVTAYNADGESTPTTPSSVNNGRIHTNTSMCKPSMPGEYVGTYNVTDNSARISFMDNSDNEDSFTIKVYNYNTNQLVKTISVPAKDGTGSYQYANITNLNPNTIYKVKVNAESEACGASDATTPSSVNNGRFKTVNSTCPTKPSEYVGVYNVTNSGARISFIDNADNEDGFKAYVYNHATGELVKTVEIPAQTGVGKYQYANIESLCPDTIYEVKVSAFNSSCESDKTAPSSQNNGRFKTKN